MAYRLFIFTGLLLLAAKLGMASNDSHEVIGELLATSCIDCHGSDSDTGFDVSALSYDFRDETQFRNWMKVFDRVSRGEMPPKDDFSRAWNEARGCYSWQRAPSRSPPPPWRA